MIELIANPEKFDGKRVFVSGFVRFEFEGNALYLHEEDYQGNLWKNGIALGVTSEQQKQYADCESKNCDVIGTFYAVKSGYSSLWSGYLINITTMKFLTPIRNKPTSSRLHEKSKQIRSAKSEQTANQPPSTGSLP